MFVGLFLKMLVAHKVVSFFGGPRPRFIPTRSPKIGQLIPTNSVQLIPTHSDRNSSGPPPPSFEHARNCGPRGVRSDGAATQ